MNGETGDGRLLVMYTVGFEGTARRIAIQRKGLFFPGDWRGVDGGGGTGEGPFLLGCPASNDSLFDF